MHINLSNIKDAKNFILAKVSKELYHLSNDDFETEDMMVFEKIFYFLDNNSKEDPEYIQYILSSILKGDEYSDLPIRTLVGLGCFASAVKEGISFVTSSSLNYDTIQPVLAEGVAYILSRNNVVGTTNICTEADCWNLFKNELPNFLNTKFTNRNDNDKFYDDYIPCIINNPCGINHNLLNAFFDITDLQIMYPILFNIVLNCSMNRMA